LTFYLITGKISSYGAVLALTYGTLKNIRKPGWNAR